VVEAVLDIHLIFEVKLIPLVQYSVKVSISDESNWIGGAQQNKSWLQGVS